MLVLSTCTYSSRLAFPFPLIFLSYIYIYIFPFAHVTCVYVRTVEAHRHVHRQIDAHSSCTAILSFSLGLLRLSFLLSPSSFFSAAPLPRDGKKHIFFSFCFFILFHCVSVSIFRGDFCVFAFRVFLSRGVGEWVGIFSCVHTHTHRYAQEANNEEVPLFHRHSPSRLI